MNQKASYIDYNGKRIYAKVRGKSRAEGVTCRNDPKKLDKRYALRGKSTTVFEYIMTYQYRYNTPYDDGFTNICKLFDIPYPKLTESLHNMEKNGYIVIRPISRKNRRVTYECYTTNQGEKWYREYAKDKWRVSREEMQNMVNPKLKLDDFLE